VNSVAPGIVVTNIMGLNEEQYEGFAAPQQLVNRAGKPAEIASLVAYMLSDESTFVTGSVFLADGGWCLKA
jgi:NAD(P)-dependent dehydrogenase (short-subunit alcohol dehydrogenase family)